MLIIQRDFGFLEITKAGGLTGQSKVMMINAEREEITAFRKGQPIQTGGFLGHLNTEARDFLEGRF